MKIFEVNQYGVKLLEQPNNFTLKNGTEINAIFIGEVGRGCNLCVIPTPTSLSDVVAGTTKSGGVRLNKDYQSSTDALVLLKPTYGFRGGVKYSLGDITPIATGYIAQGDAGRMGGNNQHLIIMKDGESVQYTRTGRLYGDEATFVVFNEQGNIQQLPLSEYNLL